jgi:hypothetical protein
MCLLGAFLTPKPFFGKENIGFCARFGRFYPLPGQTFVIYEFFLPIS